MVLTKVYSIGGEEPTNNPPTSARHPSGMMTYAELYGDVQKPRIKSHGGNSPVHPNMHFRMDPYIQPSNQYVAITRVYVMLQLQFLSLRNHARITTISNA